MNKEITMELKDIEACEKAIAKFKRNVVSGAWTGEVKRKPMPRKFRRSAMLEQKRMEKKAFRKSLINK